MDVVEPRRRVLVSGCFDLLHSGHVEFFHAAAALGDELYVALGSDRTILELKGRPPVNPQEERLFVVSALRVVHHAFVSTGSGAFDFAPHVECIRPCVFVVNEDGHSNEKAAFFAQRGIEYKVLPRTPHPNLPLRSTTSLRTITKLPYRIDLAGGWLDQPFVNRVSPGPVITVSIDAPLDEIGAVFTDRSGMATSTRRKAIELWGPHAIPRGDPEHLARVLFCYDNPPGTTHVSGSQDAIGIVIPGVCRLDYGSDQYWPSIHSCTNEEVLQFVENHIVLFPLRPRSADYDPLQGAEITKARASDLASAAARCWDAVMAKDAKMLGSAILDSFHAQISMFPHMWNEVVSDGVEELRQLSLSSPVVFGYKLSGAGGGGYLVVVVDNRQAAVAAWPGSCCITCRRVS